MSDTLTPVEMANRMLDRARTKDPHNPLLSKLEALRNEIAELARENGNLNRRAAQMRQIIDDQAHLIQGGVDRIAELEAELKDTKAVGEQCAATTGRRLSVQCGREAGHDGAHVAEVGGGRISWHGESTSAGAR